jgi:hypothetical protein
MELLEVPVFNLQIRCKEPYDKTGNGNYWRWDDSLSESVNLNGIYDVLGIINQGFLICHENRFWIIPFEHAVKTTPLEGLL